MEDEITLEQFLEQARTRLESFGEWWKELRARLEGDITPAPVTLREEDWYEQFRWYCVDVSDPLIDLEVINVQE